MPIGKFITLEGGEGAGKSTQVSGLCDRLRAQVIDCIATREPGGSRGAMEVRRLLVEGAVDRWDPMSELLLHSAARREHVVATIRPALDAGSWVVSDRFADSTMAYQGYGHGLGRDVVQSVTDLVTGNIKPDLTIILDLPVAAGLARAGARGHGAESSEDRYERMDIAFHERLREGFRDIARREPERCVIVDAAPDAETVAASVWHTVATRLNLR